jgi:GTP-binding protein EngB required for normal cell division
MSYGYEHLHAGLSKEGRTEQATFLPHPEFNIYSRPVYVVDTPGYGDKDAGYRNDMGRLLVGSGMWLPTAVTFLWVVKAGRNIRQESDEFLRSMLASPYIKPVFVVTHIDKVFEDRYRDIGPTWRETVLDGVPTKDPRWKEQRRILMTELNNEVVAGLRAVVGPELDVEVVYACLDGWMMNEDEDDEFAQAAPWPWAREELTTFFGIQGRRELREWLDRRIGISPPACIDPVAAA